MREVLTSNLNSITKQFGVTVRKRSAEGLLEEAVNLFGDKVVLGSSFSAEDQVILDMFCKVHDRPAIFTLDTGRLPQETFEVIERTRKRYGIDIDILFPEKERVEKIVSEHGPNLFYESVENRKLCCKVRKIEPLKRKLENYDAWICGLRAGQSVTRMELKRVEADYNFKLIKLSPIADWSVEQVWEYIKKNDVPYNKLHDEGYPSIGCSCCTRAVKKGEDIRAGRWWWEQPAHKECGLHLN